MIRLLILDGTTGTYKTHGWYCGTALVFSMLSTVTTVSVLRHHVLFLQVRNQSDIRLTYAISDLANGGQCSGSIIAERDSARLEQRNRHWNHLLLLQIR